MLRILPIQVLVLATLSRKVQERSLTKGFFTEVKLWPLTRDRAPNGVRIADITDLAEDSEVGNFEPDEVAALLVRFDRLRAAEQDEEFPTDLAVVAADTGDGVVRR